MPKRETKKRKGERMVQMTSMPKKTVVELLQFLAEQESFEATTRKLEGQMTVPEIRAALRELALELSRETARETNEKRIDVRNASSVDAKTKEIISFLSPHEEETLLTTLRIFEDA